MNNELEVHNIGELKILSREHYVHKSIILNDDWGWHWEGSLFETNEDNCCVIIGYHLIRKFVLDSKDKFDVGYFPVFCLFPDCIGWVCSDRLKNI